MSDLMQFQVIKNLVTGAIYGVESNDTVHAMQALSEFTGDTSFQILVTTTTDNVCLGYWLEAVLGETCITKIWVWNNRNTIPMVKTFKDLTV